MTTYLSGSAGQQRIGAVNKKQAQLAIALIVIIFATIILVDTWMIMRERQDLERFRKEFDETFDGRFEEEFDERYEKERSNGVDVYGHAGRIIHIRHGMGSR